MDVKITREPLSRWKRYRLLLVPLLLVFVAVSVRAVLGDASSVIARSRIQTAGVERGDFVVSVRGNGTLQPRDSRWVSIGIPGRVEEMHIQAGTKVVVGEPLFRLSSRALENDFEEARLELKAAEAESRSSTIVLEMQLLALEDGALQAGFKYETSKIRLDAEAELLEHGLCSENQYRGTQLEVEQLSLSWQAQKGRVEKMKQNLSSMRLEVAARVGLVEKAVERARSSVEGLVARATMSGVVQVVSLELGQQVGLGFDAVLIVNEESLMAVLQIQELQVRDIALGQPVIIDTRASRIEGSVFRIDPASRSGQVQVDVLLTGNMPNEARPDLSVDGRIQVNHLRDVLFVSRPALVQSNSQNQVYRLSAGGGSAEKVSIEAGQSSIQEVVVLSGLEAGDRIIVSDTSDWEQHDEVLIH